MESPRKAYLLEQYRHGVLHTETPNPIASAIPAWALDTTPQFAERRSNVSLVLVITTHTTMFALPTRQLESPAPNHSQMRQLPRSTQSQLAQLPNPPWHQKSIQRQQSHSQHSNHLSHPNLSLMCAQPQSHSTHQTIRFIQHNTAKSTNVIHTLLHLTHQTTDIILIQEPLIMLDNNSNTWTTITHPSLNSILPPSAPHLRPHVATFLFMSATHISLTPRSDITNDPDVQCLTLTTLSTSPTLLLDIYNEQFQAPDNNERTMERGICNIPLLEKAIIVGDINTHHPWWNSNAKPPKQVESIINWTDMHNLQLINEEDTQTYDYTNVTGTPFLTLPLQHQHQQNRLLVGQWMTRSPLDQTTRSFALSSVHQQLRTPPPTLFASNLTSKRQTGHNSTIHFKTLYQMPSSRKKTTTLPKSGFRNYSTTPAPIHPKLWQHHLSYSLPPLLNFETRRSSFAFLIARVVVVIVTLYPCHTPLRGKTTPKIRNPHHIKPLSTPPNI